MKKRAANCLMQKMSSLCWLAIAAIILCVSNSLRAAEPTMGDAPHAPKNVQGLPGAGLHSLSVTGGFNVDTSSREQVRSFYNSIYTSSDGIPIGTTANISNCTPGTNSSAFQDTVSRRINWFRAMAGLPATITLDAGESAQDQSGALMMSANTNLLHTGIPASWHCFSSDGTNAAANSNLSLGDDGPDAITGYIWDFGAGNSQAGHRRWILYPQTQVMADGDVPAQAGFDAANATWIFDANFGGPRPVTRSPYVAWPPAGYAPYQIVFPQWSFALSNADFSAATVGMKSNGVSIAVTQQPYATGEGENTLVWYPSNLDPTTIGTAFPFSGADTVYSVSVSNVVTSAGAQNFSYAVTVFNPSVPGADYVPTVISGTNHPSVYLGNPYACVPVPDPNVTGYQWLTAQSTNGNFLDGAEGGPGNFTTLTSPGYSVITNVTGNPGSFSFYLAMPTIAPNQTPVDQFLQLRELFFPATNTTLSFKSRLGSATANQIAKLQASTNGGTVWQDIYKQAGSGSPGESSFTTHSLSLSNYAGVPVMLRFNYHFNLAGNGTFFNQIQTSPLAGWAFDNVTVTNTAQFINLATNATASTNFIFTPAQATNYYLLARALIFNQFPLDWGPVKPVAAIVSPPVITLGAPVISGNQVQLNFTVTGGPAFTFHLLQADQLGQIWLTNASALLTTNVLGSAYGFTATNSPANRFYRVQTP